MRKAAGVDLGLQGAGGRGRRWTETRGVESRRRKRRRRSRHQSKDRSIRAGVRALHCARLVPEINPG